MTTSGPRLARLMTMVPWLLAHDGVTIEATAEHFGISTEQCEKDLWLLVVCGLPGHGPDQLVDIQFWDDGRIHVLDPQTLDRPLHLSGDEIMALLIALRLLVQVPGQHDRTALHQLIERLERSLGSTDAAEGLVIDSGVASAVTEVIDLALAQRRAVVLVYAAASDDAVTERTVHPMTVFTADGRLYLEAYCERAEAIRTFRLDRILSAVLGSPLGEGSAGHGEPTPRAVAHVALAPEARWALDIHPFDAVVIGDSVITATLEYQSEEWLTRTVLAMAGALEVTGPPEVRTRVADAATAVLAAYS
ncbi:MAG: WYL domain-containing protein [Candidatus Nanopelagicales bacterium]|nr:WYL domain-containing protein [Candidatus Nanopelagicales bacterium]